MRDPQVPPEMVENFRTLSQWPLERFANDGQAAVDWSLMVEAREWRLPCGARVSDDH